VALGVPVIVKRHGEKNEVHKLYLSQDRLEFTAADMANIVCGDDYWNVSAQSDATTGSKSLQKPVEFTMPYLQELMGGNMTLIISSGDPPPVTRLAYNPKNATHTRAQGPARGSAKGSGRGRQTNNVWRGGRDDDWSPDNNDGRRDQPPAVLVHAAPTVPNEYYLDVMHMASESRSTPWELPRHHVHETSDTTNKHPSTDAVTTRDSACLQGIALPLHEGRCDH
jgi:hypothetical protein